MVVEYIPIITFFFLIGTCIGSFLTVLIDRIPRGESFLFSSSHCESCQKKLTWYDMIPLVSFFLLGGKCRYCKTSLSFYYPFIELLTGLFFLTVGSALVTGFFGTPISLLFVLFVGAGFIVIFFTDIKYGIIPDFVVGALTIVAIVYALLMDIFLLSLFAGLGGFVFFYSLFFFTKGKGMGFGDVKLAFLIGMLLGPVLTIVAFYVAFLTGAAVSLILVLLRRKKFRGGTIPFGPFLIFGATFSSIFGSYFAAIMYSFF